MDPEEAEEMFDFADKDKDSKIGWEEFQVSWWLDIDKDKDKDKDKEWEEFHVSRWLDIGDVNRTDNEKENDKDKDLKISREKLY